MIRIRDLREDDLPALLAIYNDVLLTSTAIYRDEPATLEERRDWWQARVRLQQPVLAAVDDSGLIGFASFGDFRAFDGYRFTVEHSVYVRSDARRMGAARALMQGLVAEARALGKHALVGAVESGNTASLALHSALGFAEVGRMPQVGAKFGRWLDLTWMQLLLDERAAP